MSEAERIRRLPILAVSQSMHAIFGGLAGGTTLILFYTELGLDKTQIGLFGSLMHLCGPLVIFIAPFAARFGLKRTAVLFYGSRKVTMALMALVPWLAMVYSTDLVFPSIVLILGVYGFLRVVAETAIYPWMIEVIPNRVRGQFEAINSMATTVCSLGAIAVASHVIETYTGFWRFQVLIGAGGAIGVVSALLLLPLPGGEPRRELASSAPNWGELKHALGDRNLRAYILGIGTATLPMAAWAIFVPLFLLQEVGLAAGDIVMLQTARVAGAFLSSYIWGWAADRFGSRPVAVSGLALAVALPIGWLTTPHGSAWSFAWAAAITLVDGIAATAWWIGLNRLLYTSIVPPDKKTEYMAVYYTAQEVTALASPLLAGLLLSWLDARGAVLGMTSYTFFFVLTMVICAASLVVMRRIRDEGALSTLELWSRLPGAYPELAATLRRRLARRRQR